MFAGFPSSPFKSISRRLSKGLTRASEVILGITPAKALHAAVVAGDEEKAIEIYTVEKNGNSLENDLHPSLPFPTKKLSNETPLHLAFLMGFKNLVVLFLARGGCPNAPNKRDGTCLHSLCSKGDNVDIRNELMNIITTWNGIRNDDGISEVVSINHVDVDGNAAIHYAAYNGLQHCASKLMSLGAIISIVNKAQRTCCEMADEGKSPELANMLELALVFQPDDVNMAAFEETHHVLNDATANLQYLMVDCGYISTDDISTFIDRCVGTITSALDGMTNTRAEALLNTYSWNVSKVIDECKRSMSAALQAAYLEVSASDSSPLRTPHLIRTRPVEISPLTTAAAFPDLLTSSSPIVINEQGCSASIDHEIIDSSHTQAGNVSLDANSVPNDGSYSDGINIDTTVTMPPLPPPDDFQVVSTSVISADIQTVSRDAFESECAICGNSVVYNPSFTTTDVVAISDDIGLACQSKHLFCLCCWSSHLQVQVRENGAYCLRCPGYKCGDILDIEWASLLLVERDLLERLKRQRSRNVIDCCSKLHICSHPDCDAILHIPVNENIDSDTATIPRSLLCSNEHSTCSLCNKEAHSPCSCTDWQDWLQRIREVSNGKKVNGDDIANDLWVEANTKGCPRCKARIEKDEGCNHMTCRKCRHEFCWICMQEWTLHSNSTGGFFQCNRFVENIDNELGNAQMESRRQLNKGRKMARFIHHFTRYLAHGESAVMEAKMQVETLARIMNELRDTESGTLVWLQGDAVVLPSNGTQALDFLRVGFDELIKCRRFLKSSFAFAFYAFDDYSDSATADSYSDMGDHNELSVFQLIRQSRGEGPTAGRSRRNRVNQKNCLRVYERSFQMLQSDLEMLTELLSDVVGRRRLRASKNQIQQMTNTVKSKRIEFEKMIVSAIQQAASRTSTASTAADTKARIVLRRNHNSSVTQQAAANGSARQRRHMLAGQFVDDYDDVADIAAWISHIESIANSSGEAGTDQAPDANDTAGGDVSRSSNIQQQVGSEDGTLPIRRVVRLRDQQAGRRTGGRSHASASRSSSLSPSSRHSVTASNDASPASPVSVNRSNSSISWRQRLLEQQADDEEDDDVESYALNRHLTARAAEEEDLNRAILMSLQGPTADEISPAVSASSSDNSLHRSAIVPYTDAMATLVAMGFNMEEASAALQVSAHLVSISIYTNMYLY